MAKPVDEQATNDTSSGQAAISSTNPVRMIPDVLRYGTAES